MIVLLFFSLIALLFTYLESVGKFKNGFAWGMALVTLIAAIHYDFGSDYWGYFNGYKDFISIKYSLKEVMSGLDSVKDENGWLLLMWLVRPFGESGFYVLIAIISIFQGVVIYQLIKKYVPVQWRVFALFIYLFDVTFYVGSMSGLRQHLAMVIIGCALPMILERKILRSLIVVLVASTIHKSSLICIPLIFWGFLPTKKIWVTGIVFVVLYFALLFSKSLISTILDQLFAYEEFERYEMYLDDSTQSSFGLGRLFSLIPYVLTLIYLFSNNSNEEKNRILTLGALSMVLSPISTTANLAFRILYYFDFFTIISFPIVFAVIKNRIFRWAIISAYVFYIVFLYVNFFLSPFRYDTTFVYHSLFALFNI